MIELNKIVAEIHNEAIRLNQSKLNTDALIKELDTVSKEKLDALYNTYRNSEGKPVNSLRFKIIEFLRSGTYVDIKFIDSLIEEAESKADKNSFKAWGYFSILYPIISRDLSFDVTHTIRQFGTEIIQELNIGDVAANPFVIDFKGPRNFGSDHVWMAIYNKSHPNQKTAIQLFFQIDHRGLICHLYDRLNDRFINSKKIEEGSDMRQQVISFFDSVKNKMIEDNGDTKNVRYRKIGVKTNAIYKISHGTQFFKTFEEIQYCIDNNIVVMHEDTAAIGKNSTSQFEDFKNAKAGDLFYLCWGNSRFLLVGQFIDDKIEDYEFEEDDEGWKQRKYRFLFESVTDFNYTDSKKRWTSNYTSTCVQIPEQEYALANDYIFREHFRAELWTDFDTVLITPEYGAASRKKITIDELGEPKLQVEIIASELAGIIDSLKSNKGQMLGIFGSWGRGKTFLYEHLKKQFDNFEEPEYQYKHVTFNAWKYQETETIWAHLYGELLDSYIGKSKYVNKWYKIFSLNIKRKGWWPLISIFGSIVGSVIVAYFISSDLKKEILLSIVGSVGVLGVINGFRLYYKYYKPLKATIASYANSYNFNEILGLQAEIQKELIVLTKHWLDYNKIILLVRKWLGLNKKTKRRLLLFVDDIDRCKEEKIIQIIDALRVMLDDDDLKKRIIVLVAVDGFLLERAIRHKYKDFDLVNNPPSKYLIEEYMDKLFISGIKLPKLSEDEQGIILRNYAIHNEILERIESTQENDVEPNENEESVLTEKTDEEIVFPDTTPSGKLETQNEFFLLEKELELLKKYSKNISDNITPRQLRIYMYRYLLAKNIASSYLRKETGEEQLSDNYCDFIARAIALRTNATKNFDFINNTSLDLVKNETLRLFTPKLIEIVVPY